MAIAQLAVFVRSPAPGSTKTRLAETLGARGAANLYEAFVDDTLSVCERLRAAGSIDVAIWHVGDADLHVRRWADRVDGVARKQPEGDLGDRLTAAFSEGLARYERVVVIGSDAPTLPASYLVSAFDALAEARLVLGPTSDGGYYTVGASQGVRPRFDGVRWSTRHAFADTRSANHDVPLSTTPPWYDVDDPNDLHLLASHLQLDPAAAPATAKRLEELGYK